MHLIALLFLFKHFTEVRLNYRNSVADLQMKNYKHRLIVNEFEDSELWK